MFMVKANRVISNFNTIFLRGLFLVACVFLNSVLSVLNGDVSTNAGTNKVILSGSDSVSKKTGDKMSDDWVSMFDGKTLKGWKVVEYAGHGNVEVTNLASVLSGEARKGHENEFAIVVGMGDMLTGIVWTNDIPRIDYEVELKAMRIDGSDFFCGLTVPVNETNCSLILGGWGGGVVGISSIDGYDASENETSRYMSFKSGRWYVIRMRVTKEKIEAWLDDEKIIDVKHKGRRISLRPGDIEKSVPFGIASYQTTAAYKDIKIRTLVR